MSRQTVHLLSPNRTGKMGELAAQARSTLSQYAGMEVSFDATGLQFLDEWIERHLRRFPSPSPAVRALWGAFLGETFRRRYGGQWAVESIGGRPRLGVLCPKGSDGLIFVDIMDQVNRRVKQGMRQSLAFYYTLKSVELKSSF
ncbi:MAG TPA: hypothetical protein ENL34_04245 [Chloroflexi bacterium]|nr:hypothetical protein [Chloroflexota bacterium]